MKKISLILLCLICTSKIFASHVASAELRYEYTGTGNDYNIYLTVLKACEPNNSALNSQETINIYSASLGSNLPTTLVSSPPDTIESLCAPGTGSCWIPGSFYQSYERRIYTGTATLPPASDWLLTWSLCCRNSGITNLLNPGSQDSYVESFLDNSANFNTSAYIANPFPFRITAGTLTTVPLQTVDAENDSISYDWYQPLNAQVLPIAYATGYSLANPMGGTTLIDAANQTLVLEAPLAGKYVLAFKVSEYRNGQLIGWTKRDFQVNVVSAASPATIPMPVAGSLMHYTTCPGQANSISINFEDSTATDSVYLDITSPSLPGWSFSTTASNGIGTANASISWTTPATMNPATLPHFYFNIFARDNACPEHAYAYYAVVVETIQCNTDSVWAGDANGDYTVNVYDPLAIAIAYGQTGSARPGATTTWQAEYCAPWANSFSNTVNMKHSDCNGDGVVDNTDLGAVTANYGLVHLKHGGPKPKTTGNPDLYFDLTGIVFTPGANVSIPINLGSATSMMNDFYGLGTTIDINGITLASNPTITYPSSWIGSSANTLSFTKALGSSIDWAYARTDHQNISGQGTIAYLNFTVPTNAPNNQQIALEFNSTQIVNNNGTPFTAFNEIDATANVVTGIGGIRSNIQYAYVIPNPSATSAVLSLKTAEAGILNIRIMDVTGRTVWSSNLTAGKDESNIALPSSMMAPGMYTIQVSDQRTSVPTVIKWMKQ